MYTYVYFDGRETVTLIDTIKRSYILSLSDIDKKQKKEIQMIDKTLC